MCGIAGIIGTVTSNNTAELMLKTMRRRGPDDCGVFQDRDVCLLHSRLSIIDPEGGIQPMTISYGTHRYTIVYNGELYNTEELRSELRQYGHSFATRSDTEVILRGYVQWKEAVLQKINGIFGFAVWNHNEKKLFVARDRMGVKPFFYTNKCGKFVFASEIKTILQSGAIETKVDGQGIAQLLLLGPGRLPGSGVFCDVNELMPGYCGWWSEGTFTTYRYWKLRDSEHTDSFEETCEKVRYLLTDAFSRQMVSDVPIGTFLSGGLDSSLISAVCSKEKSNKGLTLQTFSVDYENNEKYFTPGKFQPNSDDHYIDVMCQELGCINHKTVLNSQELFDALDEAVSARDLPGMADVDASLLVFCKSIRNEVKVALSGECADEIFGGYPWYRDPDVRALEGFPWAQNTVERGKLLHPVFTTDAVQYINDVYTDTIRDADILPGTDPMEARMKQMVVLNQKWFMQTLLDRKDRMSMYSGLEVRVPFCDHRIAEYLYAVPWSMKDYQGREKGLLRHAMSGILPDEVLWRKKSPYPKTYDPAYYQLVKEKFNVIIDDRNAPIHQIVNTAELAKIPEQDSHWPWYGQLMKLPQTMAYFLQIDSWMRKYKVEVA